MQGSLFANACRLGVSLANAPPVKKLQGTFNQIGLPNWQGRLRGEIQPLELPK